MCERESLHVILKSTIRKPLNKTTNLKKIKSLLYRQLTYLVESDGKVKGRISGHVSDKHVAVLLQELVDCEGLTRRTVLAGIVQGSVTFTIGYFCLERD